MIVRLLRPEDRPQTAVISHIAFHSRKDDMDAVIKDWGGSPDDEDWGAFADDGQIMARIINNHLESRLDGHVIMNGGIGAVSTLPEYRESGAIREIFNRLLPAARERGEVISTLYPFNHAFYRKFGYETVSYKTLYEMTPDQLKGFRQTGWTRQWKPGDEAGEFLRIYDAFTARLNMSIIRDEKKMRDEHIHGEFWKDRHFVYLLGDDNGAKAYVVFQDVFNPEKAKLEVQEAAWIDTDGFRMILGFLARFTADYGTIRIPLPTCMDLKLFLQDPYAIRSEPEYDHMIRVINAKELLSLIRKPEGTSFVINVSGDEQIPENNGTWLVREETVIKTDKAPDMLVSHRALGPMAVGGISLDEAEYRTDVKVRGNRDVLNRVFVRKPIYVGDHF